MSNERKERKSSRVVSGVKNARAIKEILLEKLGEKIFVEVEPFLAELHENKKQLRLFATPHYVARLMGDAFAHRVQRYREEIGISKNKEGKECGILKEIKDELRAVRKRGEEAEDSWRVWPEFVAWVKSNAMDSFDQERNASWKHGNQVNNFIAIVLPTQVERHSAIEFLAIFRGMEVPVEETKANVRPIMENIEDFFLDKEDEVARKVAKPLKADASNLERIAAKTHFGVELERDRRMIREARNSAEILKPWLKEKGEDEEHESEGRTGGEPRDRSAEKLFHAMDLPDPGKYLEQLEELLKDATKTGASHLKAIGELTEAASMLVPVARIAHVDVLGIMKQAASFAENKNAKAMRAVTPGLRALYKLHAPKSVATR